MKTIFQWLAAEGRPIEDNSAEARRLRRAAARLNVGVFIGRARALSREDWEAVKHEASRGRWPTKPGKP